MISRQKSAHIWERDQYDWYVEPYECSLALIDTLGLSGRIWDPAAGSGRILASAKLLGREVIGSDIVRRTPLCEKVVDFLSITEPPDFDHIVTNPPFRHAEQFVLHAISLSKNSKTVSMLLPLVWMAGFSTKRNWLPKSPLTHILPMSPRPSMPPGAVIEAGEKPGNGTKDFAWFVWQCGYEGEPKIHFLNTKPFKHISLKSQTFLKEISKCEQNPAA